MGAQRGHRVATVSPLNDVPEVGKPLAYPTPEELVQDAKNRILGNKQFESTIKSKKTKLLTLVRGSVNEQLSNGVADIERFHLEHDPPTTLEGWANRDFTIDLKKDVVDNLLDELAMDFIKLFLSLIPVENHKKAYSLESHNEAMMERMVTMEHHLMDRSQQLANCRYSYFRELTHLRSQLYMQSQDGNYEVIEAQYFDPCEYLDETLREQMNTKIRDSVLMYYNKLQKAKKQIEELEEEVLHGKKSTKVETMKQVLKNLKVCSAPGEMWRNVLDEEVLKEEAESWAEEFMKCKMQDLFDTTVREEREAAEVALQRKNEEMRQLMESIDCLKDQVAEQDVKLATQAEEAVKAAEALAEAEAREIQQPIMVEPVPIAAEEPAYPTEELQRLESHVELLKEQTATYLKQIETLRAKVDTLEKALSEKDEVEVESEKDQAVDDGTAQALNHALVEIDELKETIKQLQDEITTAETSLQEARKEATTAKELAEKLESEVDTVRNTSGTVTPEYRELYEAVKDRLSALASSASSDVDATDPLACIDATQEILAKKDADITMLRTKVASIQTEVDALEQQNLALTDEVAKYKTVEEGELNKNRIIGLGGPENETQTNIACNDGGFWMSEQPDTEALEAAELELEDLDCCANATVDSTLEKIRTSRRPPVGYGAGFCKPNVFRHLFTGCVYRLNRMNELRAIVDGMQKADMERVCDGINLLQESTLADHVPELRTLLFGKGFSKANVTKPGTDIVEISKSWADKVRSIVDAMAKNTDDVELGVHEGRRTFLPGRVIALRSQQVRRATPTEAPLSSPQGIKVATALPEADPVHIPTAIPEIKKTGRANPHSISPNGFTGLFASSQSLFDSISRPDSPVVSPAPQSVRFADPAARPSTDGARGSKGDKRLSARDRGRSAMTPGDTGVGPLLDIDIGFDSGADKKSVAGLRRLARPAPFTGSTIAHSTSPRASSRSPSPCNQFPNAFPSRPVSRMSEYDRYTAGSTVAFNGRPTKRITELGRSATASTSLHNSRPPSRQSESALGSASAYTSRPASRMSEHRLEPFTEKTKPLETCTEERKRLSIRVRTGDSEVIIRRDRIRPMVSQIALDDTKLPRTKSSPSFLSGKIRPVPLKAADPEWAKKLLEKDCSPRPSWEVTPSGKRAQGGSYTTTSSFDNRLQTAANLRVYDVDRYTQNVQTRRI